MWYEVCIWYLRLGYDFESVNFLTLYNLQIIPMLQGFLFPSMWVFPLYSELLCGSFLSHIQHY